MKFQLIRIGSIGLFCILFCLNILAQEKIIVKGYGANESSALNDAKKNAIGKKCGETIIGSTRLQSETEKNTKMNSFGDSSKSLNINTKSADDNLSLVGGSIKTFKQLNKGEENGNVYVEIEAIVTDCKKAEAIQTALTSQQMFVELQKMNFELKSLSASGNILAKPTTLAQKYHNARMLSQRGEIDMALKVYEDLMKEKIIFADPIQDMRLLSKRMYGIEGSKKYLEKALLHLKDRPEYLYAFLSKDEKPIIENWKIVQSNIDNFPPLGYSYLVNWMEYCGTLPHASVMSCLKSIGRLENVTTISKKLADKIKSGEDLNYYIDSNKASSDNDGFAWQFDKNFYDIGIFSRR